MRTRREVCLNASDLIKVWRVAQRRRSPASPAASPHDDRRLPSDLATALQSSSGLAAMPASRDSYIYNHNRIHFVRLDDQPVADAHSSRGTGRGGSPSGCASSRGLCCLVVSSPPSQRGSGTMSASVRSPAAMDEKRRLFEYVTRSLSEEEDFHFLRFEFLQRLNIVNLQVQLARIKSRIQRDGEASADDLEDLTTKLQQYGKGPGRVSKIPADPSPQAIAIRDYQFLRNKASVERAEVPHRKLLLQRYFQSESDFGDPFESHYSYFQDADGKVDPLRAAMMKYLPAHLAFSRQERRERGKEFSEGKAPRVVSALVDRLVRFVIAVTGGVFLVVPMIIMTLHPSQTKSLVTVSVALLVFSLMLSFVVRVSNVETLVSTATYAAVLVVFVGTSTASS
ncbi:hypothetical protein Purlil1_931 [Purpureocillium lilacinum]|uniref:DUF6594 domain-containing protein n=2 Tax=Purpureocillium lilacinum TaxID=33203 RepID=A0ABR0CE62_PURLI|nr:hypothetical protein Purlil1_931 [Purpureocillium lilacinum]